jgi:spore coat protein U-like protein
MTAQSPRNVIFAILVAACPLRAFADSCSISSPVGVAFGSYDVFSATPNNGGVGSLTIRCNGTQRQDVVVTLSAGNSNSYAQRKMTSGRNSLNYNLYTSASRAAVWGDGTGGSSTMTVSGHDAKGSTTLSVFGQIPAGQDAAVGGYTDSIVETVQF